MIGNNEYVFHYVLDGEKHARRYAFYAPNLEIAHDWFHQKKGNKLKVLEVEEIIIQFRED